MSRCVVNFASRGRENYTSGQARLLRSLKDVGYSGDTLFYNPDIEVAGALPRYPRSECWGWSPKHSECPYAFKYYAIQEAIERGFDLVLWLDACVVVRKPLGTLWEIIQERGLLVFDNPGTPQAMFTSEDCLKGLGDTVEAVKDQVQCCGGVIGLNANHTQARLLFDYMLALTKNYPELYRGSNKSSYPRFKAHRHDQSILTHMMYKYGFEKEPFDMFRYSNDGRGMSGCYLEARGMGA